METVAFKKTTFEFVAKQWMANKEPTVSTDTSRWRNFMLQNDVFSLIGQQQINTISVSNVIEVLTKISERGSTY